MPAGPRTAHRPARLPHARRPLAAVALALPLLALPARGAAQQPFEGRVTFRITAGDQPQQAVATVKGGAMRMAMGMFEVLVTREGAAYMLVPEQKGYMDLRGTGAAAVASTGGARLRVVRLGRSETIAGQRCDWVRMDLGPGATSQQCVATGLGDFSPDYERQATWLTPENRATLRREFPRGVFPLRILDAQGKPILEVLALEPGRVDDGRFVLPAGWRNLQGR